jgi:hypothetical protein
MNSIELKLTEEEYRAIISLLGKVEAEFSFWAITNLMRQAEPQLKKEPVAETPEA